MTMVMVYVYPKKYFNDPNFLIAPNIKHLKFGNEFNQCGHSWMTKNLICVHIGHSFEKSVILPKKMLFLKQKVIFLTSYCPKNWSI